MSDILGFVSPEGILYPCGEYGHLSKAEELYEMFYKETGGNDKSLAMKVWMKVSYLYAGIVGVEQKFTEKKIVWIDKNLDNLNSHQRKTISTQLMIEELRDKRIGCE